MKKVINTLFVVALIIAAVAFCYKNVDNQDILADDVSIIDTINEVAETEAIIEETIVEETMDEEIIIETEPVETEPAATEPVEIEPEYFSNDISINYHGYTDDGEHIPYYLFAPSVFSKYDIPLVIWLHGSGERNAAPWAYEYSGILPTLFNWNTSGVNAYIVCPQLTGSYNVGLWNVDQSVENVENLIDYFIETYNVDANRIYIVGHSLGGQGTMYMAAKLQDRLAACVALSPYYCGVDVSDVDVPIIAIAGNVYCGEDPTSVASAQVYATMIGHENVYYAYTDHANLPGVVFRADDDGNNRADIFEWMFAHKNDAEA